MGSERRRVEEVFHGAVERTDSSERVAYLDAACAGDEQLRCEVEILLKCHEEAGSFLETPPVDADMTLGNAPDEGPGTMIGRYELLELIGEGGMGLVYLAEQREPVKRRVALKIIKPGMDSRQVIARFEAERQTLAVLDHPNIAQVFDAGTTSRGRPYFVMEYVKGLLITRYCDEHKLDIEQRLRLFREVCEGVHHAHQKGIIHRDIKPSNILVAIHSDRPVPKIIDFGIAKATASSLADKTFCTFQGQLLGTPEYMSPEQVDLTMQDIDTRSDVYSLGVVLYELLAGVLPFERVSLQKLGLPELQRTIREEEPPAPSHRLSSLGEQAQTIAASRMTQVVPLARRLHRELEWIPLKAMRKDRCRRYNSAFDMADDIRNYLSGNPLIAGPETAMYRAQKFVRKHVGSVMTVVLVAAGIILCLVVSTVMYFRAETMRVQAEEAWGKEAMARTRAEDAEVIAQQQREKAEVVAEDYRRALYASRVASADVQYRVGDVNGARQLLQLCPPDLRRWEWNRLDYVTRQSLRTLSGHIDLSHDPTLGATELVYAVALSPDGELIASGGGDRTVRIWDTATGANEMTLRGHEDKVISVSFNRDGRRILSGSRDKTMRVWSITTGQELMTLRGHESSVFAIFTPNGGRIVSASDDRTIKVWDAQTGEELMTLKGHEDCITCFAVSPSGRQIASGSRDQTIRVWDLTTGDRLGTFREHGAVARDIAFSPDGKRILLGCEDNTVKIWEIKTGAEPRTLLGHGDKVTSVAFSPEGKLVASGSEDQTIRVWNSETGTHVRTFGEHEFRVSSLAFHPDGERLVSGSWDGTIKVWSLSMPVEMTALAGHEGVVSCVVFSRDGHYIGSYCDKTIKVHDVTTGKEIACLEESSGGLGGIAFSPNGTQIASCNDGEDQTVKIWSLKSGEILHEFRGHELAGAWSVAFSSDGTRLVSGGLDETVRIWDVAAAKEIKTLRGHQNIVRVVAYSPDGQRIISGSLDGKIKIWDAANGTEQMTLHAHEMGVWSLALSPDGDNIVSGGMDKMIRIWDVASGQELDSWRAHNNMVWGISVNPDGDRIASSGWDGIIKVWDMASGLELLTLTGGDVGPVAFSPNGKTIASCDSEGNILFWNSASPESLGAK